MGRREEEEANFALGNRLSLNVTVERVSVGGEIEAEGEEVFDFGPGNPSQRGGLPIDGLK